MTRALRVPTATLTWDEQGQPWSPVFQDVYFSRVNGLAETRHVFLRHNDLPQRWQGSDLNGGVFCIAELGFGTGLNFLAAWQAWRESPASIGGTLHFVSFEKYPLRRDDLIKALALWPELAPFAQALIDHYPLPVAGAHRRVFDAGRVHLTLFIGDAQDGLDHLDFMADAWFLDGFAPARNPQLWMRQLCASVRQHSRVGTTFSTFTAVGEVRRTLQSLGFDVRKVAGFGRKRDMLCGQLTEDGTGPDQNPSAAAAWLRAPTIKPAQRVSIVGAGMAGCLLARTLAERGVHVHLLEASNTSAGGASGNPQGALYFNPGLSESDQERFALTAYLFSQQRFSEWHRADDQADWWHPTGLLQAALDDQARARQARIAARWEGCETLLHEIDAETGTRLSGTPVHWGGLRLPGAGWVAPAALCAWAIQHPRIHFQGNTRIQTLQRLPEGGWILHADNGSRLTCEHLALCCAQAIGELLGPQLPLPLKRIRGQITQLPVEAVQSPPQLVLCGDGYIMPARDQRVLIGATFDLHDTDAQVKAASHQDNLGMLERWLPGVLQPTKADDLEGRVSFRCATSDYLPIAGPVQDPTYLDRVLGVLRKDASQNPLIPDDTWQSGLYVLGGLGSKGLATAPLLAEYVADLLTGQPTSLDIDLVSRIHPARFQVRALMRQQR